LARGRRARQQLNTIMYKFKETTPDWLCHEANLDFTVLPAIQKELLKLFLKTKKDTLVPYTSTFVEIGGHAELGAMYSNCPLLMAEMNRLELIENFISIAFISVDSAKEFPPHVDGWVSEGADIALNIPLIGCEGTHTVWYDGEVQDKKLPTYAIGSEIAHSARVADPRTVVEIGRCDASIPHWININVLHRPETHHDKFRVAASIRFVPDPMNKDGELWSHLIK